MSDNTKRIFEEQEKHPAFGKLSLHRVNGGHNTLFGSSVIHNEMIELKISTASRSRDLHRDWIFAEKLVTEIWLSPVQLAEALFSMNTEGVPCTLKTYTKPGTGEWVYGPECPASSRIDLTRAEFREQTKKAAEKIRALEAKLRGMVETGKPVGKKALEEMRIEASCAAQEVDSNMPFIAQSFDEAAEAIVKEEKGEIEAHNTGIV